MKCIGIVLGTLALILGIIGIFLPLLPTTPLLLLAAALYARSSVRLYNWLLKNKYLGPYILNFRKYKAVPLSAKIISMLLIWGSMLFNIVYVIPWIEINIILLLISGFVSWYILSLKTR